MADRTIENRKRALSAVERAKLQALNGFFTEEQVIQLEKIMDQVEGLGS